MQCLLHSKLFIKFFLESYENNDIITNCIYDILSQISLQKEFSSFKPSKLFDAFGKYHKNFKGYTQHDSQEFLRLLLEDMSKELNLVFDIPKYKELNTFNKSKKELNINYNKIFLDRENSIIVDLFYSQICNTFTCAKCYSSTFSFEKIIDLPLLLGISITYIDSESVYDISDLLSNYFKQETIQFDTKCLKCNNKCNHTKISKISKLPKILIITLQRYNYRSKRKNSSKITFNHTLELMTYVDKDCIGTSKFNK